MEQKALRMSNKLTNNCNKNQAKKRLRIAQCNLNGLSNASDQIAQYCIRNFVDILCVQEPVSSTDGRIIGFDIPSFRVVGYDGKLKKGAIIVVVNPHIKLLVPQGVNSPNFACVQIFNGQKGIMIASVYCKYGDPATVYGNKLRSFLGRNESRVVLCIDSNGHSPLWFCPDHNSRGRIFEELIEDYELKVHNTKNKLTTYSRPGMGESNIDITLSTNDLKGSIKDWNVKDITDSDHRAILFTITTDGQIDVKSNNIKRYNIAKANWLGFTADVIKFMPVITGHEINYMADKITETIKKAAEINIPRINNDKSLKPIWWSKELTEERKSLNKARRKWKKRPESIENIIEYKGKRNKYIASIRAAKMSQWKNFSDEINRKLWGKTFKWIKSGGSEDNLLRSVINSRGNETKTINNTIKAFLDQFVPDDQDRISRFINSAPHNNILLTDEKEIHDEIWKCRNNKAPGTDEISPIIAKKAWPVIKGYLHHLYNTAMKSMSFPTCWKTAKLFIKY